jgi:hypothetical protein
MIYGLVVVFNDISGHMSFTVSSISDQLIRHGVRMKTACLKENRSADGEIAAKNIIGANHFDLIAQIQDAEIGKHSAAIAIFFPHAPNPCGRFRLEPWEVLSSHKNGLIVTKGLSNSLDPRRKSLDIIVGIHEDVGLSSLHAEISPHVEPLLRLIEVLKIGKKCPASLADLSGMVCRTVIHHKDFEEFCAMGLSPQRTERHLQMMRSIARGDDDGDKHQSKPGPIKVWQSSFPLD